MRALCQSVSSTGTPRAVGRQRADAAAVRDVAALEDVEPLLDQVVDPGFELLPGPPAHAAVGVLHVRKIHPPLEPGLAVVRQFADRNGIRPRNLLAFFEETAAEMFFEQAVHGIKRRVGLPTGEHQAVVRAPDDIAVVAQDGFGEIDGEIRRRPPDVYPARGVSRIGMRSNGAGWRLSVRHLKYGQFNTAHAFRDTLELESGTPFCWSGRRGQHDLRLW